MQGSKKPPSNARIDWDTVKALFLSTTLSGAAFCKAHQLNYGSFALRQGAWIAEKKAQDLARAQKVSAMAEQVRLDLHLGNFRASESIRSSTHYTAGILEQQVRARLFDSETGELRKNLAPREMRDLVDVLDRAYALEMKTAGHYMEPEQLNVNQKLMVAGVTADQLMNATDEQLAKALETMAALAKPAGLLPAPATEREVHEALAASRLEAEDGHEANVGPVPKVR